jgi:hypothetical protein
MEGLLTDRPFSVTGFALGAAVAATAGYYYVAAEFAAANATLASNVADVRANVAVIAGYKAEVWMRVF